VIRRALAATATSPSHVMTSKAQVQPLDSGRDVARDDAWSPASMIPSLRSCAARSHQPLIRFVGKRQWPSGKRLIPLHEPFLIPFPATEPPHPHPAASAEIREQFADFLKKRLGRSSDSATRHGANASTVIYNNFWEAPIKFWKPRVRELDDWEMESIMVRW
jgi:small subunit ribosomal protein YMR-31